MILAIVGPTGVGKTKLSIELAKKYDAIIINCDAVQVYKELDIGSAKIKPHEKQGIEHFLFDIVSPNEDYNVSKYQKDIRILLEKYKDRNIIIVGGTGLYLKSALYDYKFLEEVSNNNFDNLSNDELYNLALQKDKNCNIHKNNRVRLIRFLNRKEEVKNSKELYKTIYIGLTTNRDTLYEKINKRVDEMIDEGLLDEVRTLYHKYPNSRILNTAIGYKEFKDYFNHEIDIEIVKNMIKQNSRHYAKRQYTWFKNQMNINWFLTDYDNFDNTINNVIDFIEKEKN